MSKQTETKKIEKTPEQEEHERRVAQGRISFLSAGAKRKGA
jgi:hypothetical protein